MPAYKLTPKIEYMRKTAIKIIQTKIIYWIEEIKHLTASFILELCEINLKGRNILNILKTLINANSKLINAISIIANTMIAKSIIFHKSDKYVF